MSRIGYLLAAAIPFIGSGTAFAEWGGGPGFYHSGHMMGAGPMGWTMLLFWGVILVVLILLVRWVVRITDTRPASPSALEILKQRLARGEIDIQEFEEKKSFL